MSKTPEQVLAEGAAAKTRSTTGTNDVNMRLSVGSDNNAVVKIIPDMYQDVIDFHKKFGLQYDGPPRHFSEVPEIEFRMKRMSEEVRETVAAFHANQAPEFFDGHLDQIYILLGTMHLCGYDVNEGWRRVHAANMAKERAHKGNPGKYGDKADIVKPADWVAPDLTDLVVAKP